MKGKTRMTGQFIVVRRLRGFGSTYNNYAGTRTVREIKEIDGCFVGVVTYMYKEISVEFQPSMGRWIGEDFSI